MKDKTKSKTKSKTVVNRLIRRALIDVAWTLLRPVNDEG